MGFEDIILPLRLCPIRFKSGIICILIDFPHLYGTDVCITTLKTSLLNVGVKLLERIFFLSPKAIKNYIKFYENKLRTSKQQSNLKLLLLRIP